MYRTIFIPNPSLSLQPSCLWYSVPVPSHSSLRPCSFYSIFVYLVESLARNISTLQIRIRGFSNSSILSPIHRFTHHNVLPNTRFPLLSSPLSSNATIPHLLPKNGPISLPLHNNPRPQPHQHPLRQTNTNTIPHGQMHQIRIIHA